MYFETVGTVQYKFVYAVLSGVLGGWLVGALAISDDDICANCTHCQSQPGELSLCDLGWPGVTDVDGYIVDCVEFNEADVPLVDTDDTPEDAAGNELTANREAAVRARNVYIVDLRQLDLSHEDVADAIRLYDREHTLPVAS